MKLLNIISEMDYRTYEGMVKIQYNTQDYKKYDNALRALPGVTTVAKASSDFDSKIVNYKVKLISQRDPEEAFEYFKKNALKKYSEGIGKIEIGTETIEEQ